MQMEEFNGAMQEAGDLLGEGMITEEQARSHVSELWNKHKANKQRLTSAQNLLSQEHFDEYKKELCVRAWGKSKTSKRRRARTHAWIPDRLHESQELL